MGGGSSRSRVEAYQSGPEDSDTQKQAAESSSKPKAKSKSRAKKRASAEQEAAETPASPIRVQVRAGSRKAKAPESVEGDDEESEALSLPHANVGPQLLHGQAQPLPQPQPLHQRRVAAATENAAIPLLNQQVQEEQYARPEDRHAQEEAALAAIRAALPKPKHVAFQSQAVVPKAKEKDGKAAGDGGLLDVAKMQATRARERQAKSRYPEVQVSIPNRKVLLHWVKMGRKRVIAKRAQAEQKTKQRKKRKPMQVDKLVELYLESQEELERLCFEDPEQLIFTQIELLTRRIDELDDEVAAEKRRAQAEAIGKRTATSKPDPEKELSQAARALAEKRRAREKMMEQQMWDWSTAFDQAVEKREAWKRSRGDQEKLAQERWRQNSLARWPAPAPAEKAKVEKADVVEQMKSERERLKSLLDRFEAQQRREKKRQEQPTIDLTEALLEEQRAAMAERAQELREQRRREAEEKKRRKEEAEERRRQEEERRRQAEQAERQRQRLLEEEQRRKREKEAEEAERRRREEEERELERLRQEKKESERKRAEERRLAAEREAARRREIEAERARREELLAAERRARQEEEQQRIEEELRRAEEERRRLEQIEEERAAEEEKKRRDAITRNALLMSAFDDLEDACEGAEESFSEEPRDSPLPAQEPVLEEQRGPEVQEEEPPPEPSRPQGDWMSRALGALHDGEDSDSDSDEGDGGEPEDAAGESALAPEERLAADVQLLKLTGALAKKIDQIHGD
eukprot:TRINITY_DN6244_c0_g1_i1.p1 TRINITY_DN6244_c0_g1~~TRINITY_DN6244_c0_g1_i1.p1  ORF type:complete len:748 (-),score=256.44 TRINITY_DN6244_c0_g1_i1:145-2388(-)